MNDLSSNAMCYEHEIKEVPRYGIPGTIWDKQHCPYCKLERLQQRVAELERNRDALEADLKRFVAHAARGITQPPSGWRQDARPADLFAFELAGWWIELPPHPAMPTLTKESSPLPDETRAATSRRAHGTEDAGRPGPIRS